MPSPIVNLMHETAGATGSWRGSQESERVERLEDAIRDAVCEWSLAEVVTALQAMGGIDLIAAVAVVAEIGDLSRFQNPQRADELSWSRTLRKFDRRHGQAWRYHQGRQRSRSARSGRISLELSPSSTRFA